jgi:hypothetical protein
MDEPSEQTKAAAHSIHERSSLNMKRAVLPIVFGLLGFGLFFTSVAMAASGQPLAASFTADSPLFDDPITDTDTISPTLTTTHPVASAIADYFDLDYSEVANLHEEGLGFGIIARTYFISTTFGITPTDVISEFQSGVGWGEILKGYGLHPGLAGKGQNLGAIMSTRKWAGNDAEDTWMPPGLRKKNQPDDTTGPAPAQLRKSNAPDQDVRGGPPSSPPGQGKDKDKDKGKGKGKK